MANDAGFAAAVAIRESVLNDALLVAYGLSKFPKVLDYPLLFGAPTDPSGTIDLFLYPITASCGDGTLTLQFQLLGGLTLKDHAGVEQTRGVLGRLEVDVAPQLTLVNTSLAVPPDPGDVNLQITLLPQDLTVTGWTYDVVLGSAYPPDLQTYLAGTAFLTRLQQMLQLVLTADPITIPPVPLSFLGHALLAAIDQTALVTRFVPGALVLGLSVFGFTTAGGEIVNIVGNETALANFGDTHDVAAAINPAAVPVVLQTVENQIRADAAGGGASVDSLVMVAGDGAFDVSASASNSHGSVDMTFSIMPEFSGSRPGAYFADKKPVSIRPRRFAALDFTPVDIRVSATASILATLFKLFEWGIFGGEPLLGLVDLYQLLGDEADGIKGEIQGASTGGASPRLQRLTPTDPGNVTVKVLLDEFRITPEDIFTGLTVTLEPLPAALIGPRTIPSNLLSQSLTYTARLPLGVDPRSGALHIVWTVTDPATAAVVYEQDAVAAGRTTYALEPQLLAPGASSLVVACRVYTILNLQAPDILNDQITLAVGPPRPANAYVRWRYAVANPQVQFDQTQQSWGYTGRATIQRWSNIHRTDRPCQNAAKRSRYETEIDTFDELPFPIAQVDAHRTTLCDYCFYGGPAGLRVSL